MSEVEVMVTGPADWMEACVADLLDARLIACAHMWPINSRYWWEGTIRDAEEVRAAMHTTSKNAPTLIQQISEMHPYKVSCVLESEPLRGNPAYLTWINSSTTSST